MLSIRKVSISVEISARYVRIHFDVAKFLGLEDTTDHVIHRTLSWSLCNFHKLQSIEQVFTETFLFQREVCDRGEQRAIETAREEELDTGQEADVDPKVLRKLKDTIVQRDNEISILTSNYLEFQFEIRLKINKIEVVFKMWNVSNHYCWRTLITMYKFLDRSSQIFWSTC